MFIGASLPHEPSNPSSGNLRIQKFNQIGSDQISAFVNVPIPMAMMETGMVLYRPVMVRYPLAEACSKGIGSLSKYCANRRTRTTSPAVMIRLATSPRLTAT